METETKVERPRDLNEKQLLELATTTAEIIVKADKYSDMESCIEDCKDILEDHWDEDGYQLAKRFEDKSYNITTMLVEELDSVCHDAWDIIKDETKKWVKANDIKLDLKVGDKVMLDIYTKNNVAGEIMKLYPETAQYGIWTEEIKRPKETSHHLINFEKIKEVIKPE